jgi:hypothetical protein
VVDILDRALWILGYASDPIGLLLHVLLQPLASPDLLPLSLGVEPLHRLPCVTRRLEEAIHQGRPQSRWVDDRNAHIPERQLDPERIGVAFSSELRGIVRRVPRQADDPVDAGDDDKASTGRPYLWNEHLSQIDDGE